MKPLYKKRVLSLLLSFILLFTALVPTGCSKASKTTEDETNHSTLVDNETTDSTAVNTPSTDSLFNFSLYDNKKKYTAEELSVQQDFENYLKKLFVESYEDNSISINFLIEQPENYGIEKIASRWPDITIEERLSYSEESLGYLSELESFSYDALTYEQQLIYDTLKKMFESDSKADNLTLFSSNFSPDGIVSQLPLIFTEYIFHDRDDIEDYLTLLETLYDYIKRELDYETYRNQQGFYLSEYTYDSVIEQCQSFLYENENYLTDIFKSKLNEYEGLTDTEISAYLDRNTAAIQNSVIPAYQLIIDTLSKMKNSGTYEQGLCYKEYGTDYYNYLLENYAGTDKSAEELIELVDENIKTSQKEMMKLNLSDSELYSKLENPDYLYTDPEEILSYLTEKLEEDFPTPACTNYSLKEIDSVMATDLVVAFYILSPIDQYGNNIIYVNQDKIDDGNDLLPTLAHEGLPGHMYQHNYFWSINPSYFRSLFSFTGYSEGWAEYIEVLSYDWCGLEESVAEALKLNLLFSNALCTRVDLGVNYEGWTLEDTKKYLSQFTDDQSVAKDFYDTVISSPAVFFPYYIGYLELTDLKETAMEELGTSFCEKDFHKFYLEIGPTYFGIIADRMDSWIESLQNQ